MAEIDLAEEHDGFHPYEGAYPATVPLYRVPDDRWELYRKLSNMLVDLEEEFRAHEISATPELPDDLKELVGILPDEELAAIAAMRAGKGTPELKPFDTAVQVPPGEDKTPEQIKADMIARAQSKCPHRVQARRGRDIICAHCHKVIIANTQSGVDILDTRGKTEGQWTVTQHRRAAAGGAGEVIIDYDGNAD